MNAQTITILILIGITAGVLGGFVGVGGGIIIVPALIYFLGFTTHQAMGTSIGVLLPPIGILAAINYYRAGDLNVQYAMVIACAFILGGYAGSKLSLGLKGYDHYVKLVFGVIMLYVSVQVIRESIKTFLGK